MQQEQQTVLVTPEEIVHLILEEMEAGLCPTYYSNLVPSTYDVYLYIDDLERLRPLQQRSFKEAEQQDDFYGGNAERKQRHQRALCGASRCPLPTGQSVDERAQQSCQRA